MKKKAFLAIILSLLVALTFALSGCGGSGAAEDIYVPSYLSVDLPEDVYSIDQARYVDGVIYFTSYGLTGTKEADPADVAANGGTVEDWMTEVYGTTLYKINADGTGLTKIEGYEQATVPEIKPGSEMDVTSYYINFDTEGNIWEVVSAYAYHMDGEEWIDDGTKYYLRKLDTTGKELFCNLIEDVKTEEYDSVYNLTAGNDGYVYVNTDSAIIAFNQTDGKRAFVIDSAELVSSLNLLNNGQVAAMIYGESGKEFKVIDPEKKALGKSYPLSSNAETIYNGSGDYLYYYNNTSYLYGVTESGKEKKIFNWMDSDIDCTNVNLLTALDADHFFCITNSYDDESESGTVEFITLTRTPASEVKQKTKITLATLYTDYDLRSKVIAFNKKNPDYRIEIIDYSQYDTEDDWNAGYTKLTTEIISGNVPDIINTSSLPVAQFAAKGLLEDLYPYIDNDKELSRDSLVSAIKTFETDGKLYEAVSSFQVLSLVGATSVVGEEPGWTFKEMSEVIAAHPEAKPFAYYDRDSILSYFTTVTLDDFIDWQTGKCSFDSQEFIDLLEFANTFPAPKNEEDDTDEEYEDSWDMIYQGKVLFDIYNAFGFEDSYLYYDAMYRGDFTFKGFPTSDGVGNYLRAESGLAMSSKCENKDGAWEFIRTFLTEDYQSKNSYSFATNKKVFDKQIAQATEPRQYTNEDGTVSSVNTWQYGSFDVEDRALTQEEVNHILSLIDTAKGTFSYNESVLSIIQEEAAYYFAGDKSAKEAAGIIQSRMNIYVNEQR